MGAWDLWFSVGFSLVLLAASAGLIWSHLRTWRRFRQQDLEQREHDYRRRQFRRRMQSSAMLGLLAVVIFVGHWMTSPPLPAIVFAAFWAMTVLLVGWLGLLAIADALATRAFFRRLRDRYLVEQVRLQAELHRVQQGRANGKAQNPPQGPTPGSKSSDGQDGSQGA